ncbi:thiamine phosphate synthase [Paenibacillus aestuarii]|uniref:Thiamine phosphate synthase n=1 Tax=Paenibacillus aestuarii TaxID=516965 RepID=A0ABW0K1S3_9BACL|nr:thiamine phosphate synthase [Paenibacillus aestuarii]
MAGYELHVISNGKLEEATFARIAGCIHPYVTAIHIREKEKPAEQVLRLIGAALAAGVPAERLYVNGHLSIAATVTLGGLHMAGSSPQLTSLHDMSNRALRTGVSVHGVNEARQREQEGADYLVFGHIYETGSKPGLPPRGLELLSEVTAEVSIPVIAIGGVTPERIRPVLEAGASGVAVMSGIWDAADPEQAVRAYANELTIKESKQR